MTPAISFIRLRLIITSVDPAVTKGYLSDLGLSQKVLRKIQKVNY